MKLVRSVVWLWLVFAAFTLLGLASGCRPTTGDQRQMQVDLALEPSPPTIGNAEVRVKLADVQGEPIEGAQVRLEGNMNHAGMKPSFADLREQEAGLYTGTIDFTMGGDWFILVSATTRDGRELEHQVDVPGVKSQ